MIPKIIHYCWFGGNPLPELAQKCIASWKKYCPDYEIKEWNESNYDVTKNAYMYEAYQAKKWGFVPDYARLDIIYEYGGIYLDTDVELLRSLDGFLSQEAFMGFEDESHINFGQGFGAVPGHVMLKRVLEDYADRHFFLPDGMPDLVPSPKINTAVLLKCGMVPNSTLQEVDGLAVYPTEYFCPKDFASKKLKITKNTVSIHHFDGSWVPENEKYRHELRAKLYKVFPKKLASHIARFVTIVKFEGIFCAFRSVGVWLKRK